MAMASSGPGGGGGGGGGGGWAAIARKDAAVEPKVDIASLLSTAGLKTVVVDANALIGGGVKLSGIADQFFTVREVLQEVRDPASRFHLATLPVTIRCLEPSDEALAAVTKFSRATGDFQSLSNVDLKLIALAYTLEAEMHGTAHIRSRPPPLVVTPSSTHRQLDPPGWGTVDNPEEWEGIEEEEPCGATKAKSHIVGLKSLNLDLAESNLAGGSSLETASNGGEGERGPHLSENDTKIRFDHETVPAERVEDPSSSVLLDDGQPSVAREGNSIEEKEKSGQHLEAQQSPERKPAATEKLLPSLEGKLNVAEGVDASKGEFNEDDDDWQRASCRTTRRKYLKREAKRSAMRQAAESAIAELPYSVGDEEATASRREGQAENANPNTGLDSSIDAAKEVQLVEDATCSYGEDEAKKSEDLDEEDIRLLQDGAEIGDRDDGGMDDIASNGDGASSRQTEGVESEQSWMVGPLWKSNVACMTADYAMQNVLLQMGLRLLSTTGMHIRELNKWVLKCQACNHVMSDVGRIFCPKCGNGGTLFKISVTVGQNGTVHAGRTRRINLRGTRYSLPMPKGGREGAAQNPILREDQLPQKLLRPRAKKATDLDTFSSTDVIFTITHEKKVQKLAGVKTAAAIFGGRRNPNERRGARQH